MLHYCVICGVLIGRYSNPPGTVPRNLDWYQELRVVQVHASPEDASGSWLADRSALLSGMGFVNSIDQIVAPSDHQHCFTNNDANLASFTPFHYDSWCFAFHASCWDILLERVPEGRSDLAKFATIFFQTLFCTTWGRYKYLRPGHDFGGAAQFQKPVENPVQNMTDQGFEYLLIQPSKFRGLSEIFSSIPHAARCCPERSAKRTRWRPLSGYNMLSGLPIEVLFLILSLLPSADIQQLRLASRHVALMTGPASLPQSFWHSRYCADFEMGFAAPSEVVGNQNWRDAYFTLKHVLGDSSNSISARARNRRRIWKLAGINSALLAQFTTGICLRGDLCTESTRLPYRGEAIADDVLGGSMVSSQISEGCDDLLRSGSWRLHDRVVMLPLDECTIRRIRVSTVLFNSQQFVSGLQFQLVNTSTRVVTDLSLGYISPNAGHFIDIPRSTRISGLELAVCSRGLAALRVVGEGADFCGSQTQWVGDIGSANADMAVGTLRFSAGEERKIRLVAALDAFKMIALGVAQTSSDLEILEGYISQPLWTPSYPRETVFLVPTRQPGFGGFDPVLNVDFGGPNEERLSRLTRIVAHMLSRVDPIVGLTFYFTDHSSTHFGRHGSMEVSSIIDGPGGERISSVVVERFSDKSNPYVQAREKCVEVFHPPIGQQITGFTAVLEAEHGSFRAFGLQCEKVEIPRATFTNEKAHPSSISAAARLSIPIGSYLIQESSNGCRAYTSANLRSVKSIRFSSGRMDSPRLLNEVSGLWFEYYESRPSILSNSRKPFSEKYYTGRVVRVSVSTSLRTLSYPERAPLPAEECTILRFEDNCLEELASLVWVFNDAWDFPRVLKSPKPYRAQILYWDPIQFAETRPWRAPQPALWAGATVTDRLVSITGYQSRGSTKYIIGMRFTYSSGVSRAMGDVTSSQALEPVAFLPDEVITKITLSTDWDGLLQMMFRCSKRSAKRVDGFDESDDYGDGDSAQIRHTFVGVSPDELAPSMTASKINHHYIDFLRWRFRSHYPNTVGDAAYCVGDLPRGQVVGLWGFLRPDQNLLIGCVLLLDQEASASGSDDA
ncbi:hypothetical protein BJX65DRAFT_317354 [Aspergillus insuetus]